MRVGDVIQAGNMKQTVYYAADYQDANWKGSLFYNTGKFGIRGTYIHHRFMREEYSWYHTREKNSSYGMDVQRT